MLQSPACVWKLLLGSALFAVHSLAQDPFEIHIYEYEPLSLREYSLEAHLNWSGQGTNLRDGSLLPTRHQAHLTLEPTFGISETFAVGFMFLNAYQPGYSPEFAGWRVLPHFYAPETWRLPFRLGFVPEFSLQLVFNPVFERALHGPGTRRGWNFEPALLVRMKRKVFSPSIEYYGEVESVNVSPRAQPEVHQIFIGGD